MPVAPIRTELTRVDYVAVAIAAVGCAFDIRSRRIPNVLTFGAAAAGLLYHTATGGFDALVASAAGWLVGVLMFIVPFALRGMGGGDVKLLGALGAWVGPLDAVWIALYTGVAGGVMALGLGLASGHLRSALANLRLLLVHWGVVGFRALPGLTLHESRAPKLAYAIPILCGTLVATWLR
jgi:prepilin peptidase CpaA